MRQVEGYLSRLASAQWRKSVVWCDDDAYTLERPGEESVRLGSGGFQEARAALQVLIRASRD